MSDALHEVSQEIEQGLSLDEERIGIDLWARCPSSVDLGQVEHWATSTRTHREPWSLAPPADITANSTYPAAVSLYYGSPQIRDEHSLPGRWQYLIALPVVLADPPWHSLPVGAITIGSTLPRTKTALRGASAQSLDGVLNKLEALGVSLLTPG